MPELPEVETVKRSLQKFLLGRRIIAIEILRGKSFPNLDLKEQIIGQKIVAVERNAKIIDIVFANNWHLLTHLKMTGQLLYLSQETLAGGGHPTNDILKQLPGKHTRVIYQLDNQAQLFFNDMRVFGWMRIFSPETIKAEWQKYGPDANKNISLDYLREKLKNKKQAIKIAMMDNKIWSGIGNIYASEILFAARILPNRAANSLSDEELRSLILYTKKILDEAVVFNGTTFDGKYVDAMGKSGNYWSKLKVYGKEGENCQICASQLKNIKLGGRASFYCERCQK